MADWWRWLRCRKSSVIHTFSSVGLLVSASGALLCLSKIDRSSSLSFFFFLLTASRSSAPSTGSFLAGLELNNLDFTASNDVSVTVLAALPSSLGSGAMDRSSFCSAFGDFCSKPVISDKLLGWFFFLVTPALVACSSLALLTCCLRLSSARSASRCLISESVSLSSPTAPFFNTRKPLNKAGSLYRSPLLLAKLLSSLESLIGASGTRSDPESVSERPFVSGWGSEEGKTSLSPFWESVWDAGSEFASSESEETSDSDAGLWGARTRLQLVTSEKLLFSMSAAESRLWTLDDKSSERLIFPYEPVRLRIEASLSDRSTRLSALTTNGSSFFSDPSCSLSTTRTFYTHIYQYSHSKKL